jgi:hypothetical protein
MTPVMPQPIDPSNTARRALLVARFGFRCVEFARGIFDGAHLCLCARTHAIRMVFGAETDPSSGRNVSVLLTARAYGLYNWQRNPRSATGIGRF